MKSKDKKKGASKRKKSMGKEKQWIDKKKNIVIRKDALKKIYDHFIDYEEEENENH